MQFLLLAAGHPAAAEHAVGGHVEPAPLELVPITNITALVVFGIFAFVIGYVVWPRISAGLDDRRNKILGEIKAAEDARAAAKQAQEEFERQLTSARDEAANMIKQARADAQRVADEMKARNEQELAERVARANADIEAARRAAVADLQQHAATLATAIAGRILKRQINDQDNERLVQESVQELASGRR
jgi:F-type H+-transporting ATPase subunit b